MRLFQNIWHNMANNKNRKQKRKKPKPDKCAFQVAIENTEEVKMDSV